ncbi:MAG: hypothetical protein WCE90_11565 [Candidatus Zixiibacteriota bacterium]
MSREFYNNVYYFITVPTAKHFPFFNTAEKKSLILTRLEKSKTLFRLDDFDYSILSNHYHFVSYFQNGEIIPKLLQIINGGSAYELNKIIENRKPVWGEYHIYVIDNEMLLAKVRGYVVGNPLKHDEVKTVEKLEGYPFSSFHSLTKRFGKEQALGWIQSVIVLDDTEFIQEFYKKTNFR